MVETDDEREQTTGGPRFGGAATRQNSAPWGGRIGEEYGRQTGKNVTTSLKPWNNITRSADDKKCGSGTLIQTSC